MSQYTQEYYLKNAEKLKAAARARYRQRYSGLKRGEKVKIEIPEKHVGPLRDFLERATTNTSSGDKRAEELAAKNWLYEELRHV